VSSVGAGADAGAISNRELDLNINRTAPPLEIFVTKIHHARGGAERRKAEQLLPF
jgi:hypothetical protein